MKSLIIGIMLITGSYHSKAQQLKQAPEIKLAVEDSLFAELIKLSDWAKLTSEDNQQLDSTRSFMSGFSLKKLRGSQVSKSMIIFDHLNQLSELSQKRAQLVYSTKEIYHKTSPSEMFRFSRQRP